MNIHEVIAAHAEYEATAHTKTKRFYSFGAWLTMNKDRLFPSTPSNAVLDIDWKALREQKLHLRATIDVAEAQGLKQRVEGLLGLLHLIDAIQDQAAEHIGEEAVFGKKF